MNPIRGGLGLWYSHRRQMPESSGRNGCRISPGKTVATNRDGVVVCTGDGLRQLSIFFRRVLAGESGRIRIEVIISIVENYATITVQDVRPSASSKPTYVCGCIPLVAISTHSLFMPSGNDLGAPYALYSLQYSTTSFMGVVMLLGISACILKRH